MSNHAIRQIPAVAVSEGAGVTVHRTIGTPALRHFDPFMMLDHFNSDDAGDYIAGFPDHPHRGFCTFTYMLDGYMEHQDSMGNTGSLKPGSAQWMKAGSGVIHSEMPKQENGLMRGFQLWINLPAEHKMDHPEYQEYAAEAFPVVNRSDYQLKVLIGRFIDADTKSEVIAPIIDMLTAVSFFDAQVSAGGRFQYQFPQDQSTLLYLFEGSGQLNGEVVDRHSLVTLDRDGSLDFLASDKAVRFILVSGMPVNEPIVQYGPFVMNSREEIHQAMLDYQSNQFVRDRAWMRRGN